jgi:hypothetical protein
MPDEPTREEILQRLVRCLNSFEQCELIEAALKILGARCSFDMYRPWRSQKQIQEDQQEDLDSRLFRTWPADWPTQEIVELDVVGDPGYWIEKMTGGEIFESLFGDSDLQPYIHDMAIDYLYEYRGLGAPRWSDFVDSEEEKAKTDEEEEAKVQQEFIAFFRYWRERVLQALESQNPREDEV